MAVHLKTGFWLYTNLFSVMELSSSKGGCRTKALSLTLGGPSKLCRGGGFESEGNCLDSQERATVKVYGRHETRAKSLGVSQGTS